jgi:hypothetical protein
MNRYCPLLFASWTWLACTEQPASPVAELAPEPAVAPAVAPTPADGEPPQAELPEAEPEVEQPAPPCTELERLAQRACARLDPERCSSGTCEGLCKIEAVSWFDLRTCQLHGFSQLQAGGQSYVVYIDEGQIWLGLDTLDDIDSISHIDADEPEWVALSFEEYQSDDDEELTYEFHVIATNVCALVDGRPRCSKPIVAQYSELEEHYNSAGRTTRKIDVGYTAEVELERGETGQRIVIVANQKGDRQRASKRAPKARFLAAGEHRLEPLLDRELVLVDGK